MDSGHLTSQNSSFLKTPMLFNSTLFLFFFLPIAFFVFFAIALISKKLSKITLCIISLIFYSFWTIPFLLILISSIFVNYLLSKSLDLDINQKKGLIITSIFINLIFLFSFKYYHFIFSYFEISHDKDNLFFPIGISFYTFTQLSYLIDRYRNPKIKLTIVNYILYVTWFPHLLSGPMLHYKNMSNQFDSPDLYKIKIKNISIGIFFFTLGLFKKVCIADTFSEISIPIFDNLDHTDLNTTNVWIGLLSYTLQLYFDFSGYSDMAIGISKLFNIDLPINFNSPYKSLSIIDFWRRWHITLSSYLRDYLYIPLGGNKCSNLRWSFNIMIVMILGGIWHGAKITFPIWGALHGSFLLINHQWRKQKIRLPDHLSWFLTFFIVTIAWLPFRANDLIQLKIMFTALFGLDRITLPIFLKDYIPVTPWISFDYVKIGTSYSIFEAIILILLGIIIVKFSPNSQELAYKFFSKTNSTKFDCFVIGMIIALFLFISILNFTKTSPFLYYHF